MIVGVELAGEIARVVIRGKTIEAFEASNLEKISPEARYVLRSVQGATTQLIDKAPDDMGTISQYIPIPPRELAWQAIPFEERTLLLAAMKEGVEEILDKWSIAESSGVGLTSAALLAIPSEGDFIWRDGDRAVRVRREKGRTLGIEQIEANLPGNVPLPSGLDQKFALAYGATLWGTEDFPVIPNLEPRERREMRTFLARRRRTRRVALAASVMLVLGGALPFGIARSSLADAEKELVAAQDDRARLEEEFAKIDLPESPNPIPALTTDVLSLAAEHAPAIILANLHVEAAASSYKQPAAAAILRGRANSLDDVERLRASLETRFEDVVVEEAASTARSETNIDFRIRVR